MARKDLVVNDIREGDVIVAMGSFGKSTYEDEYNSGMGSNGLTSARHDVLSKVYADRYPESYGPETDMEFVYSGSKLLTDNLNIEGQEIPLGKLLLSPTRTFIPVLRDMFNELGGRVHGVIHCTGGGQTKVSKFLPEGLSAIKDNVFDTPPLFETIQKESGTGWKEMYQVFNMGIRMEVYLSDEDAATVIEVANRYNIPVQILGKVVRDSSCKVKVISPYGEFTY